MNPAQPAAYLRRAPLRGLALVAASVVSTAIVWRSSPVEQDPAYHLFADTRTGLGIPNFLDSISNGAFLAAGMLGLVYVLLPRFRRPQAFEFAWERWPYCVLFAATGLVAAGSIYYHLAPGDERLFWDRLPMSLGFMAITGTVIIERISAIWGRRLFIPLLLLGASSTIYWNLTGDLRPYVLVQYIPVLILPFLLLLFPSRYTHGGFLWQTLGWYGMAKAAEVLDRPIFELTGWLSGHTLKHILAALAIYMIAFMLTQRSVAEENRTN